VQKKLARELKKNRRWIPRHCPGIMNILLIVLVCTLHLAIGQHFGPFVPQTYSKRFQHEDYSNPWYSPEVDVINQPMFKPWNSDQQTLQY
jgi:hypothetical protein